MLDISKKTNLLEQGLYRYELQDVAEPNLYRDIYNYEDVPKIAKITAARMTKTTVVNFSCLLICSSMSVKLLSASAPHRALTCRFSMCRFW